jgi:hypothetical protein
MTLFEPFEILRHLLEERFIGRLLRFKGLLVSYGNCSPGDGDTGSD